VRFQAGVPAAEFIGKIRQEALRRGMPTEKVEMAAPALEDVFVAVLEEREAA
jgi:hypothetical protein